MRKYTFNVPVTCVEGFQLFEVNAESEEEAKELILEGGGEIVDSELEVLSLDFKNMHLDVDPEEL